MADPHFRRTGRRALDVQVRFRVGSALEQRGELVDLGVGGAHIQTTEPPRLDARVRVQLSAPTAWDPLDLTGVVRWARMRPDDEGEAGFGVEFDGVEPAQARVLHELLAAHGGDA